MINGVGSDRRAPSFWWLAAVGVTGALAATTVQVSAFELNPPAVGTASGVEESTSEAPFDTPVFTDEVIEMAASLVSQWPTSPFDDGALPAEEPWLSDHIEIRHQLGLPAESRLVAELLLRPGSSMQVASYGTVLLEAEIPVILARREGVVQKTQILDAVSSMPGFAGSIYDAENLKLTLMTTDEEVTRTAERLALGTSIRVAEQLVAHSLDELESVAIDLEMTLRGDHEYKSDRQLLAVSQQIIQLFPGVVRGVGVSMLDNALVLEVEEAPGSHSLIEAAGDLPRILVQ